MEHSKDLSILSVCFVCFLTLFSIELLYSCSALFNVAIYVPPKSITRPDCVMCACVFYESVGEPRGMILYYTIINIDSYHIDILWGLSTAKRAENAC